MGAPEQDGTQVPGEAGVPHAETGVPQPGEAGVRQPEAAGQSVGDPAAGGGEQVLFDEASTPASSANDEVVAKLQSDLNERTDDLKRLQAEYVNYKRRVDRDRDLARDRGIEAVLNDLLPTLDDLRAARQHEELTGGFKLLAEELEKVTAKYGIEVFGEKGDAFDPQLHEALMQASQPGVTQPTCIEILQVGYRFHDRLLRPARVAVALPSDDDVSAQTEPGPSVEPSSEAGEGPAPSGGATP